MNKKTRKLLTFSIIIVIIAVMFFVIIKNKINKSKGEIISPTESFEITDEDIKIAKENENNKDKAKVIIYWNLNNEKSTEALTLFNSLFSKYSNTINFLVVNPIDNATKSAVFLNNHNITIPSATSANLELEEVNENELETLPCYVFIEKGGKLLDFTSKDLNKDSIEAYLDILAENY